MVEMTGLDKTTTGQHERKTGSLTPLLTVVLLLGVATVPVSAAGTGVGDAALCHPDDQACRSGSTLPGSDPEAPQSEDCIDTDMHGIGPAVWKWVAVCNASYEGRTCTEVAVADQAVPASVCEEDHPLGLMHPGQMWRCYTVWVGGEQVPTVGDPDRVAVCKTGSGMECYTVMVKGEAKTYYTCVI